ncbi:hypothetical protein GGQ85_003528 [Nitrobacter vulgaris]|uniref:hypothetical protein n=1 Tax=Nitrobacter vulgaris TaxID=29421 RepID=UPI00286190F6|nr:hypothetical protein [Nitrobacter vulgaris]MDR6305803.1 hypothetical protein [Nitrobacter vulgaris]
MTHESAQLARRAKQRLGSGATVAPAARAAALLSRGAVIPWLVVTLREVFLPTALR